MRQFLSFVLCATVVFVGIGGIAERAGATFRSDDRALDLIKRARTAIGGDAAIDNVRTMKIKAKTTKTFEIDGIARTEPGEMEIEMELPGKFSKKLMIGKKDGENNAAVERKTDVIIVRKGEAGGAVMTDGVKRVVIKKDDGTEEVVTEDKKPFIIRTVDGDKAEFKREAQTGEGDGKNIVIRKIDGDKAEFKWEGQTGEGDGKTVVIRKAPEGGVEDGSYHQMELFRTTLALLLSAPRGLDVSYKYAGEANVDGFAVDVIDASIGKGAVKLFLDRSTSLPRMVSYQGIKPTMIIRIAKGETPADAKVLERRIDAPETTEVQVKYSDYRSVDGLLLPFRWTQTAGGKADETVEVEAYTIN